MDLIETNAMETHKNANENQENSNEISSDSCHSVTSTRNGEIIKFENDSQQQTVYNESKHYGMTHESQTKEKGKDEHFYGRNQVLLDEEEKEGRHHIIDIHELMRTENVNNDGKIETLDERQRAKRRKKKILSGLIFIAFAIIAIISCQIYLASIDTTDRELQMQEMEQQLTGDAATIEPIRGDQHYQRKHWLAVTATPVHRDDVTLERNGVQLVDGFNNAILEEMITGKTTISAMREDERMYEGEDSVTKSVETFVEQKLDEMGYLDETDKIMCFGPVIRSNKKEDGRMKIGNDPHTDFINLERATEEVWKYEISEAAQRQEYDKRANSDGRRAQKKEKEEWWQEGVKYQNFMAQKSKYKLKKVINFWTPLVKKVESDPLVFLKRDLLEEGKDEIVTAGKQSKMLKHNQDHEWILIPDVESGQGLLFDSINIPHSSFRIHGERLPKLRRSAEWRCPIWEEEKEAAAGGEKEAAVG